MEQSQAQQQAQQMEIKLTLTLAQINAILQAMQKAPYEMAKPMIDVITEQAQAYVSQQQAQQATQPQTPVAMTSPAQLSPLPRNYPEN